MIRDFSPIIPSFPLSSIEWGRSIHVTWWRNFVYLHALLIRYITMRSRRCAISFVVGFYGLESSDSLLRNLDFPSRLLHASTCIIGKVFLRSFPLISSIYLVLLYSLSLSFFSCFLLIQPSCRFLFSRFDTPCETHFTRLLLVHSLRYAKYDSCEKERCRKHVTNSFVSDAT